MKKDKIILILMMLLLLIGAAFAIYLFASNKIRASNQNSLNEDICTSSGGHWNECGSKCSLLHQQIDSNYSCTAQCEEICECGGFAGFACPKGYTCIMPKLDNAADLLGYCEKI